MLHPPGIHFHHIIYTYMYIYVSCLCVHHDLLCLFQCIEPICHQLFNFYKSGNSNLKRFTLELVPKLVWSYLVAVSRNEKKVG